MHAGLVARDSSARWILLSSMLNKRYLLNEWHLTRHADMVASTMEASISRHSNRGPLHPPEATSSSDKIGTAETLGPVVLVRGKDCCFQCAIDSSLKHRRDRPVGLALYFSTGRLCFI